MGPNTAFCFVICGLLGIYCELIWPGKVWVGVCGIAASTTGGYFLWRALPVPLGLALLAAAAVLFAVDAWASTFQIAGTVATAPLTAGFIKLIEGPHGIRAVLAVPGCIVFGSITMSLNWAARRARRNKSVEIFKGE